MENTYVHYAGAAAALVDEAARFNLRSSNSSRSIRGWNRTAETIYYNVNDKATTKVPTTTTTTHSQVYVMLRHRL